MLFMAVLIVGISFVTAASRYISAQHQNTLSNNANEVSLFVSADFTERGWRLDHQLLMAIATIARTSGTHILICDIYGQILMCSELFCIEHIGRYVPDSLTRYVIESGSSVGQGTLDGIYPARHNYAAHSMVFDDSPVGFIIVAAQVSEPHMLTGAFIRIALIVSGAVLFLSFISAYAVTKKMTKPLEAMSHSAQSYARGDFSARVPVNPDAGDEIGVLCRNFNSMADSLQRLEELRQGFIADISHELRTPMTVIQGYVDGILDGAIPAENQTEYLSIIRGEILRLSRLVARMLDISNIQSDNTAFSRQSVNVSELLRQVILGFENFIDDKALDVELLLPDNDIIVSFDSDSLMQILTNLIDNAVKFAPQNGQLSISLTHKGSKAFVSVTNSGSVIPPADLPLLFDRFYKTDKSRSSDKSGLGLGLYIVKSIIQSHGESIQVTSENNLTTFTFSLSKL
jgi:signal transduction histidine kinase